MNPLFITHKKKLTAGSVLLASVLMFGFDGTWDRLSVALDQARGKAEEILPTDTLLSLARKQLAAAEQRLIDAEAATTGTQGQEGRLRQGIDQLEKAAGEARRRLETLRPAMSSATGISHCGTQYSQSEVRQDALQLVSFVQQCESTLAVRKAELKELGNAAAGGNATLVAARQDFQEARARFAELEVRLKQHQALAAATESVQAARAGVNEELGGDFARTLGELDKRLGKLQRRNESVRASRGAVPTGNVRFETTDPTSLVDSVLAAGKASE